MTVLSKHPVRVAYWDSVLFLFNNACSCLGMIMFFTMTLCGRVWLCVASVARASVLCSRYSWSARAEYHILRGMCVSDGPDVFLIRSAALAGLASRWSLPL